MRTNPLFEFVDAIEVSNGGTSSSENAFALEVARYVGKPTIGGSDAHSVHGLGSSLTVFEQDLPDEAALMEALHAGRFEAAARDTEGNVRPVK